MIIKTILRSVEKALGKNSLIVTVDRISQAKREGTMWMYVFGPPSNFLLKVTPKIWLINT